MRVKKIPPRFAPASKKQEMILNSTSKITLAGGSAGCFDKDTEYLTEKGWVTFDKYNGELVGQYNDKTDTVEYVKPSEYIKKPCSSFKRMSARGLDMCLTPEHRVPYWVYKTSDSPRVISYSEVLNRHNKSTNKGWTGNIKTTFKWNGSGLDIPDPELRLQVAVMADGRVVKNGKDHYTQMRFSKKRKYDRLLKLCKQNGLKYKDNGFKPCEKYSNGIEYEVIVWPKFDDKTFLDKYYNCNQSQFEIIKDEIGHWDGTLVDNKTSYTIRYFTKYKSNADFVQLVFHCCGLNTSLVKSNRGEEYTVNGTTAGKGFRCYANKDEKTPVEEYTSIDGYKYCFTVPSGLLVVRRSNKVFISGNSGKTFMLCMVALRFMQDPNATGIIFRRTTKQINTPGGIWAEATSMYKAIYGNRLRVKNRENEFVFPNGAVLKFSHFEYEHNKHDHQGGQYSFIAFDEGTHFTKGMITYLISRLRNAKVKYTPQMYISCNPDADHFLRQWVEFCLDENGIPIDKLADQERYFVVKNDEFIWASDRTELEKVYGKGEDSGISSFRFIPAKCTDNPPLLKAQPDYISNLKALGRVEELRLLHGSWTVRAEAAGYIKEKFFNITDYPCASPTKRVRAWDLANTIPSEVNRDPDFTVGVLMSKDKDKMYHIEHMERFRDRFAGVEEKILQTAIRDGRETIIVIPVDAGAAGKAYAYTLQQKLAEYGFTVQLDKTNSSKTVRIGPFATMAESGWVNIVRGDWNEQFFRESEAFDGDKNSGQHDDIIDATSSAYNKLMQSHTLPNFSLPDFTKKNNFDMKSI